MLCGYRMFPSEYVVAMCLHLTLCAKTLTEIMSACNEDVDSSADNCTIKTLFFVGG